jgi:hypothetical protein
MREAFLNKLREISIGRCFVGKAGVNDALNFTKR